MSASSAKPLSERHRSSAGPSPTNEPGTRQITEQPMSQPGVQCLCALLFLPALACATSLQADGAGDEFLVNAGATSAAAPDIGAAADGSFVICWQSTPDTPAAFAQIAAKRFGASTMALGDEFRVDSSATVGLDPAIAVDASGQFVVAWWHVDGFEIRGRRYAADA